MTSVPYSSNGPPTAPRLILASGSPQRQSLLREAGYQFEIHPANIDEASIGAGLLPSELAGRLAIVKAQTVGAEYPDDIILAADTVVAFGDQSLSKPADLPDARRMLALLEGTTHIVITGVAAFRKADNILKTTRVLSAVKMRSLSAREIEAYLATNTWQGKAGGYGIQDPDPFVTCTAGCPTNIIGLPMTATAKLLEQFEVYPTPKTGS
jgi:septum formation protein